MYYHVHKSPPLDPILSYLNPFHTFTPSVYSKNLNEVHDEIRRRINSRNAHYYSVKKLKTLTACIFQNPRDKDIKNHNNVNTSLPETSNYIIKIHICLILCVRMRVRACACICAHTHVCVCVRARARMHVCACKTVILTLFLYEYEMLSHLEGKM
jgi:hypothetical protein